MNKIPEMLKLSVKLKVNQILKQSVKLRTPTSSSYKTLEYRMKYLEQKLEEGHTGRSYIVAELSALYSFMEYHRQASSLLHELRTEVMSYE
jgi:hypothetical protein